MRNREKPVKNKAYFFTKGIISDLENAFHHTEPRKEPDGSSSLARLIKGKRREGKRQLILLEGRKTRAQTCSGLGDFRLSQHNLETTKGKKITKPVLGAPGKAPMTFICGECRTT